MRIRVHHHNLKYHAGVAFISMVFFFMGCQPKPHTYRFTRFSMDTIVEYTIVSRDQLAALKAVNTAHQIITTIDSLYWEENPGSPIYHLNHSADTLQLPDSVYFFLKRIQKYWQQTNGLFDPSVKPFLDLYGFEAEKPVPPNQSALENVRQFVGYQHFHFLDHRQILKDNSQNALALGGVAKGYAVDRAVQVLQKMGIQAGIVNAGGDLRCWRNDNQFWRVGIQHPRKNGIIAVLKLRNAAVATSGDYQRFYIYNDVRYHHLIDPRTGNPGRLSQSATVIAPTCEVADAYATALFLMGASRGIKWLDAIPRVEGMVIDTTGNIHTSQIFNQYLEQLGN